jgi:hypothetical protein
MHACAVDRAVHPAHGSTVDRTEGVSPEFDRRRGSAIQRPRMCASGSGGGIRRSTAACGGGLASPTLTRAVVHQNLHERVQNVAKARAHVVGGQGWCSGTVDGRHRKGAAWPLRRACERAKVH